MEERTRVFEAPPQAQHRRSRRDSARTGGRIGPYEVLERIASGGMGEVYEGQHCHLGRRVAIKVLHERYEREPSVLDRFHAEAQAIARIQHPGVVHVYDYGFDRKGRTFLVTELLEGQTLGQRMSAGSLPLGLVIEIGRQLASTLAAAHAAGIIHRDIKPENVFLVADPAVSSGVRVKLLDFGLSKDIGRAAPDRPLTTVGVLLGTPLYMSPEQWRSDPVDHRVDIYSLGCLMYEMACGVLPFTGRRMTDLCEAHCKLSPTPPREINPLIPSWLERLILRMVTKHVDHRPQSMLEVERELRGPDPGALPVMLAEGSSPGLLLPSSRVPLVRSKSRRLRSLAAFLFAAAAGIGLGSVISPWLI